MPRGVQPPPGQLLGVCLLPRLVMATACVWGEGWRNWASGHVRERGPSQVGDLILAWPIGPAVLPSADRPGAPPLTTTGLPVAQAVLQLLEHPGWQSRPGVQSPEGPWSLSGSPTPLPPCACPCHQGTPGGQPLARRGGPCTGLGEGNLSKRPESRGLRVLTSLLYAL